MTTSDPFLRTAAHSALPIPSTLAWRTSLRNLPATLCAGVLALGLALTGCGGGGGGGQKSTMEPPDAAAVIRAVREADTAVEALSDSPTNARLRAAENAVEAAKRAVAEADVLSAEERQEHNTTIEEIEEELKEAIKIARGDEVGKLRKAFLSDRIGGVAVTVEHGSSPTLRGTVPGPPPTSVTGLETTAVAGSAVTEGGWTGGTYTADDEVSGTSDEVIFYTDIAAPGTQPFAGDTGKYGPDGPDRINAEGELVISATHATLIASSEFPNGPALRPHPAGTDGLVEIPGTFDGAPGTYVCTPATDSVCTSSIRSGGGFTLAGGGWKFVPDEGAMVAKPDTEYHYFGWWLRVAGDGSYTGGAFHGGVGGAQDFTALSRLQSEATYRGPAAGKFVIDLQNSAAEAGEFTASATLRVDFDDASAPGTVTGTVSNFRVDGDTKDWSVELQSAEIDAKGRIMADGTSHKARTVWTIDGVREPATVSSTWSGQFHDVDEDQLPNVATGMFEAVYGDLGHMSGAFGTTYQRP